MDMKRFFLYAIAIAALALAGCGGNGGGGTTAMMPDDDDMPMMVTCPNGSMAATMAACPADTTAEEIAAATAAADTKLTAIGVEAAQTTEGGIGGNDDQGAAIITTELAITRDAMGTKVAITDSLTADDEMAAKFATVPMSMTPPLLGAANGFAGTMNVRTQPAGDDGSVEQEVVVVRTDINEPKATEFGMVHRLNANLNDATTPVNQSLVIADANVGMLMTDGITSSGTGTLTYLAAVEDDANTMMDETVAAFETMATFNGAMGTLKCAGSSVCTATVDADGKVTAVSNGWEFTPAMGATVDVEDTNYLAYGIWLKRTTKDGATTYNEVEAFTDGNVLATVDIADVVGSATYTGNSTGVYVKNVTDPEGAIKTATSGLYSADVTLRANFGGGDIGTNKQFRIEGDVKTFVLQNGEENDWGVKLESATFPNNANVFSGMTTGDSTVDKGAWNGTFYGEAPDNEATVDNAHDKLAPPQVLGELNAYFTDGAVLGGFGANKD